MMTEGDTKRGTLLRGWCGDDDEDDEDDDDEKLAGAKDKEEGEL